MTHRLLSTLLGNVFNLTSRRLFQQARELFVYEGNLTEALAMVEQGLSEDSHHIQGLVLRADILFCLKRDDEALQSLNRALRLQPTCVEALLSQASLLESLGHLKQALQANQRALRQLRSRHRYLLASLYSQRLNLLIRLGQIRQADELIAQASTYLTRLELKALQQEWQALQAIDPPEQPPVRLVRPAARPALRVISGRAS